MLKAFLSHWAFNYSLPKHLVLSALAAALPVILNGLDNEVITKVTIQHSIAAGLTVFLAVLLKSPAQAPAA